MFRTVAIALPLFLAAFSPVAAQQHGGHDASHVSVTQPQLPGQDAFGAIAEIIEILNRDPDTNWSHVSIDALRAHLLDMQRLVEDTIVSQVEIGNGLEMRISGQGPGGDAAKRMVSAHAPVLVAETGWRSDLSITDGEIQWTVGSLDDAGAEKIKALGFYGLMATGAHHQTHHLEIARGNLDH